MKLKNQSKASEFENEEDFAKVKTLLINTSTELEKKENQIIAMTSEINRMQSEIEEMNSLLRSKESEENSLKANIESSENKNTRLREYIRKLTAKCEEWEVSYDRQSRAIDRLQEKIDSLPRDVSNQFCILNNQTSWVVDGRVGFIYRPKINGTCSHRTGFGGYGVLKFWAHGDMQFPLNDVGFVTKVGTSYHCSNLRGKDLRSEREWNMC